MLFGFNNTLDFIPLCLVYSDSDIEEDIEQLGNLSFLSFFLADFSFFNYVSSLTLMSSSLILSSMVVDYWELFLAWGMKAYSDLILFIFFALFAERLLALSFSSSVIKLALLSSLALFSMEFFCWFSSFFSRKGSERLFFIS